jgi:UDP-N-acetylmuramoylalanine--D-glutamate ligase
MDFQNKKVTVMGLGHFGGGVGAARWLARRGARVTVTDVADERALSESIALLEEVSIADFHLGRHREEDFRETDMIVVNPAVRPGDRFLKIARDAGVPIRCELELFMNACPAKIIGVTGSNGKSTTASMIASILSRTGFQAVEKEKTRGQAGNLSSATWLGGNLGGSLLENLDKIRAEDWVVLEISSFQLWHFSPQVRMPRIAVVTGCTPNHLDWHGSFAEYAAAKRKMLLGQSPDDAAVLNIFDPETAGWNDCVEGRLLELFADEKIPSLPSLPGKHNRLNAALAATAAFEAGCTDEEIAAGLAGFRGLPQRMQYLGEFDGRRYFNDSAATTPESTVAALKTFDAPVWLLAGGRNKGFDFSSLAEAIVQYARGAAFFGTCRDELHRMTLERKENFPCAAFETLAEALAWCRRESAAGDLLLLSPACASTDQFRNFAQRGEAFEALVRSMVSASPLSEPIRS